MSILCLISRPYQKFTSLEERTIIDIAMRCTGEGGRTPILAGITRRICAKQMRSYFEEANAIVNRTDIRDCIAAFGHSVYKS